MLMATIDSIRNLKIPNYEIIIVGCNKKDLGIGRYGYAFNEDDISCINFDDNYIKELLNKKTNLTQYGVGFVIPGWITKKTNLITKHAKYENIIYMHDYFMFDRNWYNEFVKFGSDWDVCMNAIKNIFNQRARDWVGWDKNNHRIHRINLPYSFKDTTKIFISGSYWVAKKDLMLKEPLDEKFLAWGKILTDNGDIIQCTDPNEVAEDVEWSKRIRNKYKIHHKGTRVSIKRVQR